MTKHQNNDVDRIEVAGVNMKLNIGVLYHDKQELLQVDERMRL
jgi:hypothetical protein